MRAYKGFHGDLTCTCGKNTFQYTEGRVILEEQAKCASTGLHCAENPLDCLTWYPLGSGNRYFSVEATGSIDEDGRDTKIACTQLTLLKEMSLRTLAAEAIRYMVLHPRREWKKREKMLEVADNRAEGICAGSIAIARGQEPKVRGAEGTVLGLLLETAPGVFAAARVAEAGKELQAGVWYTLDREGNLQEAEDETHKSIED